MTVNHRLAWAPAMDYGRETISKDVSFELLQSHTTTTISTAIAITVFSQFVASSMFFTFPQRTDVTAQLAFSTWINETCKLHMVSQTPLIKSPLVAIALISPGKKPLQKTYKNIVPIMWIVFTEAISKQRSRGFWSSRCPRMVMVTMLSLSTKM